MDSFRGRSPIFWDHISKRSTTKTPRSPLTPEALKHRKIHNSGPRTERAFVRVWKVLIGISDSQLQLMVVEVETGWWFDSGEVFQLLSCGDPGNPNQTHQLGGSKNSGTPKWMVYNGKPLFKMDDLGVPLFSETSNLRRVDELFEDKRTNTKVSGLRLG